MYSTWHSSIHMPDKQALTQYVHVHVYTCMCDSVHKWLLPGQSLGLLCETGEGGDV